jgi:dihydropteroate synthase
VATSQIEELQGVEISGDAYRTDLAQQAVDALREEGLDIRGESYEPGEIELQPGGE